MLHLMYGACCKSYAVADEAAMLLRTARGSRLPAQAAVDRHTDHGWRSRCAALPCPQPHAVRWNRIGYRVLHSACDHWKQRKADRRACGSLLRTAHRVARRVQLPMGLRFDRSAATSHSMTSQTITLHQIAYNILQRRVQLPMGLRFDRSAGPWRRTANTLPKRSSCAKRCARVSARVRACVRVCACQCAAAAQGAKPVALLP